ncbi:MAG: methyl-accepting chemotaxis protein, partial [Solirubrobacterales bacterium]
PVMSALAIIAVTVPMMVWTYFTSRDVTAARADLNEALSAGISSKADLLALTDAFDGAANKLRLLMVLTTLFAFFLALGTAYVASTLTARWIRKMSSQAREVAAGDLTIDIHRDNDSQIGDIQEALGKMLASFSATINRISLAANELNGAAEEMARTSDEAGHAIGEVATAVGSISEGAVHQVELVTGTAEVVGDIEQSVRSTAAHSLDASRQSADTELLTEEGVQRATEIQEAMQSVRETSMATSEMVRSLGDKSTNIDQIVQSITDIAAQTNLLALNAAIEAARAGEQGRGFAVVAEEVRKLAEDAQASAGEIAGLIDEIRAQTESAMTAMDAGVETVENGFDAVNRNRQAFLDISAAVRELHTSSSEISSLASGIADDAGQVRGQIEEVASVAEESSASTEQVSASTQQTSAAAEEVTASAARVSHTAASLADLASRFKVVPGETVSLEALPAEAELVAQEESGLENVA